MTNLLLIEDSPVDAKLAVRQLEHKKDFNLDLAHDFAEATAMLAKKAYHAIILDLGLPGISKREAVAAIKKIAQGAAILVLSGHTDSDDIEWAIRSNAASYLVKGVHDAPPRALATAVETAIIANEACRQLEKVRNGIEKKTEI